jgi:hypothetical protein
LLQTAQFVPQGTNSHFLLSAPIRAIFQVQETAEFKVEQARGLQDPCAWEK